MLSATPLVFAAMGQLVAEKSGMLNLGVEGIMSIGALAGFIAAYHSGNPWLGVCLGMLGGAAAALVFGFLTITLLANQVASGLALAIFGLGFSSLVGKPYESVSLPTVLALRLPWIADIPLIGEALFNHQFMVYVSWVLFCLVWWFLYQTRAGLSLRAIGDSPASSHALGLPVRLYRYGAVLFGGAMCGAGGAFLSVFDTPLWSEGMVAGRGWIVLALVVFATWRPLQAMIGAYLFGGVMVVQLFVQGSGLQLEIPAQFLSSLPYLVTIIVLVLISSKRDLIRLNAPAALGQTFRPDS